RGRAQGAADRRALHLGHQPRRAGGGGARKLPPRSLLSAQRDLAGDPAAARAPVGDRGAGGAVPRARGGRAGAAGAAALGGGARAAQALHLAGQPARAAQRDGARAVPVQRRGGAGAAAGGEDDGGVRGRGGGGGAAGGRGGG